MNNILKITKNQLVNELIELGLSEGQTVMLHASVKRIGNIEGGPQTIIEALLEVLTSSGTLMMLVGWEDNPYNISGASFQDNIDNLPEKKRRAFYNSTSFDPEYSRSDKKVMGILPEYLRTYPGSIRSRHPLGYAAVGKMAQSVLKDQQWQYREGSGSPLEKLCEVGGKVLLLGSPTGNVTLLHFAENLADIPNKKIVHYKMPIIQNGNRIWKDFEEYDFINGIVPWSEDYFKNIVDEYIEKGNGVQGSVGMAECHLFNAKNLNKFGINWMERNFCCL
ncbi:MAG: aminoglycoside 3-N-acetyltransferase [Deltaproteobacteria bacterium]|nr:aminoglycoside 3-N-acetyltransferase [Deltaproteobacteria bacterium]